MAYPYLGQQHGGRVMDEGIARMVLVRLSKRTRLAYPAHLAKGEPRGDGGTSP